MGSTISVPAGDTYKARLTADAQAREPLGTLEFIRNGEVIERRQAAPQTLSMHIDREIEVERSSWFAVRAVDSTGALRAHSGPIYVHVGRTPVLMKEDLELMLRWIDRLWAYLEERNNFGPDPNRQEARRLFDQARRHYEVKLSQVR
jgi:hypothetical protein